MKKNILKISIVAIIFILLIQLNSFATTITMETKTNGNIYSLGATVTATIDWVQGMQATGFTLEYNSTKLNFTGASIEEDFYSISEPILNSDTGEYSTNIIVSWASFEEVDFTNITFTFVTLTTGEANLSITNVDCFADGNLVCPEEIDYTTKGTKTIEICALGDVNLDEEVNDNDLKTMEEYINGQVELKEEATVNADLNIDKVIDELDKKILKYYLNGYDITLPIIYGDVNLDGDVDMKDSINLIRYIEGNYQFEKYQSLINADVSVDGIINELDFIILRKLVAGSNYKLPYRVITNSSLKVFSLETQDVISGFDQDNITVNNLIKNFNNEIGVSIYNAKEEELSDSDCIGTGAIVKIEGEMEFGDIYWTGYNVLIYGDTTGDGKINAIDALALIKHINNKITFASEVYIEAGRIISGSSENPTAVDALAIIKHSNGKYEISQSK